MSGRSAGVQRSAVCVDPKFLDEIGELYLGLGSVSGTATPEGALTFRLPTTFNGGLTFTGTFSATTLQATATASTVDRPANNNISLTYTWRLTRP